jgi:hypothetical protein
MLASRLAFCVLAPFALVLTRAEERTSLRLLITYVTGGGGAAWEMSSSFVRTSSHLLNCVFSRVLPNQTTLYIVLK